MLSHQACCLGPSGFNPLRVTFDRFRLSVNRFPEFFAIPTEVCPSRSRPAWGIHKSVMDALRA